MGLTLPSPEPSPLQASRNPAATTTATTTTTTTSASIIITRTTVTASRVLSGSTIATTGLSRLFWLRSAFLFCYKHVTAETTLSLQGPSLINRVNVHRRFLSLLEVHGPGNSERAEVCGTLVAIVDVKSIVNVDLTVDRNDQTESGRRA